jgi:hypothetical protein
MGRVLAQTDVGDEDELGKPRAHGSQCLLDDPVLVPRPGPMLVLLFGNPEENQRRHAERGALLGLGAEFVHGQA